MMQVYKGLRGGVQDVAVKVLLCKDEEQLLAFEKVPNLLIVQCSDFLCFICTCLADHDVHFSSSSSMTACQHDATFQGTAEVLCRPQCAITCQRRVCLSRRRSAY